MLWVSWSRIQHHFLFILTNTVFRNHCEDLFLLISLIKSLYFINVFPKSIVCPFIYRAFVMPMEYSLFEEFKIGNTLNFKVFWILEYLCIYNEMSLGWNSNLNMNFFLYFICTLHTQPGCNLIFLVCLHFEYVLEHEFSYFGLRFFN